MKFDDLSAAVKMRDVITKISTEVVRQMRPEDRIGKVFSVDAGAQTAQVLFAGETVDSLVTVRCARDKVPLQAMSTNFNTLGYDAPGDLVRVSGGPGQYFILDFLTGRPAPLDEGVVEVPDVPTLSVSRSTMVNTVDWLNRGLNTKIRYYVTDSPATPLDASNLHTVTESDVFTISTQANGLKLVPGVTYYIRGVAENTTGMSEPSSAHQIMLTPVTADELEQDVVDKIDDAVADAIYARETADNAITSANGKSTIHHGPTDPTTIPGRVVSEGDVWFDSSDGFKPKRWTGSGWSSVQDGDIAGAAQDAANAVNIANTALTSANGKNSIKNLSEPPTAATPGIPGDTAWVWDGTTITAQYTNTAGTGTTSGNTWVKQELGHQVLASIDLGKATVGLLDGKYIKARTVASQSLVIADLTNMIPPLSEWPGYGVDSTGGVFIVEGNGTSNTHFQPTGGVWWPVKAGDEYFFSWNVYGNYAGYSGSARGYFMFYKGDRNTAASPAITVGQISQGKGDYLPTTASFTIPAGTEFVRFFPYVTPNMKIAVREIICRRKNGGELIVDGAIKAGSAIIENGAIGHAQIGSVDLGKATVGLLDGIYVKANTLTVDKLVVASTDNMLADPRFETALGKNWSATTGASLGVGEGPGGVNAYKITNTAANAATYNLPYDSFPCTEGTSFFLTMQVKQPFTAIPASSVQMGVRFKKADGAYAYGAITNPASIPASNTYTKVSGRTIQAPAGTVSASLYVQTLAANSTGVLYIALPHMSRATTGELIVDGALDAMTITAPTIQTHTAGMKGIKLTSTKLVSYGKNASGADVETFSLDAATGNVKLAGALTNSLIIDGADIRGSWLRAAFGNQYHMVIGAMTIPSSSSAVRSVIRFHKDLGEVANIWAQADNDGGDSLRIITGNGNGDSQFYTPKIRLGANGSYQEIKDEIVVAPFQDRRFGVWSSVGGAARRYVFRAESDGSLWAPAMGPLTGGTILRIGGAGQIFKDGSALKYKAAIEDMPIDRLRALLDIPIKTWQDLANAERYCEYYATGEGDLEAIEPMKRIPGVIAEDVEATGLKEFVIYDNDGQIDGVAYEKLGVALIPIVKDLLNRIEALEGAQQ